MADTKKLLDVLKIDGVVYEIHDKQARTDIAALDTNAQSTYATKAALADEVTARTNADTAIRTDLIGTVADAVDADTINGVRNALNKLSEDLSGADAETLETIEQIKAELSDPENTSLVTFLDKITSLIAGFNTDSEAEGYTTIKAYIDNINTTLTTTLSGLETNKANKTDVDDTISGVQGRIGTLETKETNDITGVQSQISTLETKEATDITGVQSQISTLETKEATDITGVQGRIGTLETKEAADIKGVQDTIEIEISDVKTIIVNNEKVTSAALNDLESRKANKTDVDDAITGVQGQIITVDEKITGVQTNLIGTDADTASNLTLKGLKNSYDALAGVDSSTITTLEKIKNEILNPSSEGGLDVKSFLDSVNELIEGLDKNTTGTVKTYIDGIKETLQASISSKASQADLSAEETARKNADTTLGTRIDGIAQTIEDNEEVTAAALNDLEDRKVNKNDIKEITVITDASYADGVLSLTKATVKVIDFEANQN